MEVVSRMAMMQPSAVSELPSQFRFLVMRPSALNT